MNYKSYSDLSVDILNEIHKIPKDIHLILGVPRSGIIPAQIIGSQLNLPVLSLNEFLNNSFESFGERKLKVDINSIENILIIDDSVNSGRTFKKVKSLLTQYENYNTKYAAIYSSTVENDFVNFYLKYFPQPRVFQWNYKNHFIATQSCYDFDGVLCVDPTEQENDDGENYLRFLKSSKPLFIPSHKISCIITSRLEKYRSETEFWLQKHGVDYGELIMLDLPNAEERRKLQIHAKFKAEKYLNRDEIFFYESNWEQAKEIFKLTNKKVFCTFNDVLIKTYTDIIFYENSIKYSNRLFNDIFSDNSELGIKFKQLKIDYDLLDEKNKRLKLKIKNFQNNKWIQFSNKNFIGKMKYLIKFCYRKLKSSF